VLLQGSRNVEDKMLETQTFIYVMYICKDDDLVSQLYIRYTNYITLLKTRGLEGSVQV
jgi:hypothetical protein